MNLTEVELITLVTRSISGDNLTKKEAKKMLEALWKKYWQGLDSFREKVVLCSYVHFPNSKQERDGYRREVYERLGGTSL